MKARDIISTQNPTVEPVPAVSIPAEMAITDVLPRLLDAPGRRLAVADGALTVGVVTESSLLEGLNRLFSARDDSSIVVIDVAPDDFSASRMARAVEDANVHLVDFWSAPSPSAESIRVTLRVRSSDPSEVASNLERYGFQVIDAFGATYRNLETAVERLLSLKTLLNV